MDCLSPTSSLEERLLLGGLQETPGVVEKVGPLAGTIFKVVDADQLVKRKVMVWVPGPIKFDTRTHFERLEKVNPGLKTTLWRLYDRVTSPSGTKFVIGVDEASVGTIAGLANLQHRRTATGVLEEILSRCKIKVALIQEPWCCKGRIRGLNLRGGQIISCTFADRPRACIYVNGVDAMPLPQLSTMDLAAAVLLFQERSMIRRIVICSSYLPYDAPDPLPNRELEDLVKFCKTKSWDLLVGCDSNSHHSVWGSSDVNPRRESLLEYLITTELQLLNRGPQPTFRNNVREEVIDITLCTSNIVHKIKGWRVSGETSLSDHCHILFMLSKEARQAPKPQIGIYTVPDPQMWIMAHTVYT
ncbi:hypothetical protein J437_LFUL019155 [Ladona fulva]|uniref:Endonuclease/exonuclease/phosphatase domain-containing protein n=1 Tax=Ladona fulva TaxID=123851 RepID=A0A8K0KR63_LADFU|nr:hypothetical protein J437_LFUL019155 [Ladona fulva]